MYLRPETISPYNLFILALLYVFPYLCARRSHTLSFCRACVPGGPIPDGFWVVWEGPPYRPHSLGDGSKCRHIKGLKTVCLGARCTSVSSACFSKTCIRLGLPVLSIVRSEPRHTRTRPRHVRNLFYKWLENVLVMG